VKHFEIIRRSDSRRWSKRRDGRGREPMGGPRSWGDHGRAVMTVAHSSPPDHGGGGHSSPPDHGGGAILRLLITVVAPFFAS